MWQASPYTVPLAAAAVVALALGVYVLQGHFIRRPRAPGAGSFAILLFAAAQWSACSALEMASARLEDKVLWANFQYIGIGAVPAAWLHFTLRYTRVMKAPGGPIPWLLAIEPLITVALAFTSSQQGLLRSAMGLASVDSFQVLAVAFGPWFWFHAVYSYALLLAATVLLARRIRRSPSVLRGQAVTVLVGAAAPWVGNVLYLCGASPFPHLDLTPFGFTVTGLAVAWGLFRFHLLDVVPVARDVVVEQLEDAVVVLDGVGRVADVNPAAERLLQASRHQLVGRAAQECLAAYPDLLLWLRSATPAAEVRVDDGAEPRTWEARRTVVQARQASSASVLVLRDITQRQREQEAMVRIQRLGAAGELSLGVSHNLNNLLTGIAGRVESALKLSGEPPVRAELEHLAAATERAASLVRRLGRAVRAGAGTGELSPVAVAEVVDEAVQSVAPRWRDEARAQATPIDVVVDIAADLPPVRAQQAELSEALVNLLMNAVDALPDGGRIDVSARAIGAEVEIRVRDDGTGMTQDVRRRIFEPFFTTKPEVGTGLGLSTAYRSITAWGGSIDVHSQPGEGSEFRLHLAVWQGPAPAPAATEQTPEPAHKASARVLVVEDEAVVSLLMSDVLVRRGHRVEVRDDGRDAVRRFTPDGHDVAFIDLGLPGMPGDEIARQLRARDPRLVTILISGWDLEQGDRRLDPFDFYLRKPFDVSRAERLVADAMAERARRPTT